MSTRTRFALAATAIMAVIPVLGEADTVEVISSITPEITSTGEAYRALMEKDPSNISATYATEATIVEGARPPQQAQPRAPRDPVFEGSWGPLVIIGLFVVLIIALLATSRAMGAKASDQQNPQRATVPDGWAYDEPGVSTHERLRRISAMPDREHAMVLLLRYSLLGAAEQTQAQFARSDTERDAFSRIPETWAKRPKLADLLTRTELAHYGGRPITEESFAQALEDAQAILLPHRVGHG